MPADARHDDQTDERMESVADERERARYRELLEELRTIIPGAQVLLGFLLTVPFASRFVEVDHLGKIVFVVALAAVAAATVLFLAPAAHHRVAEHAERTRRIRYGVHTQLGGLVLMAIAVSAGLFVVVRFLFDWRLAAAIAGGVAAMSFVVWVVRPVMDEHRGRRERSRRRM